MAAKFREGGLFLQHSWNSRILGSYGAGSSVRPREFLFEIFRAQAFVRPRTKLGPADGPAQSGGLRVCAHHHRHRHHRHRHRHRYRGACMARTRERGFHSVYALDWLIKVFQQPELTGTPHPAPVPPGGKDRVVEASEPSVK